MTILKTVKVGTQTDGSKNKKIEDNAQGIDMT